METGTQLQIHNILSDGTEVKLMPINTSLDVFVAGISDTGSLTLPKEGDTLTTTLNNISKYLSTLSDADNTKGTASAYGHVKLSDTYTSSGGAASSSVGSSSKAVYDAYTALNNAKAPNSHASTATTYGVGTGSNYGHVKLSDTYNSSVSNGAAANGLAASQNALYNAYNTLNTAVSGKAASSHSHSDASTSASGFMSTTDKSKLDYTNVVYCTCSTAAATAAKEATIDGNSNFALQKGAIAIVKFTVSNTASSCTLNVGGTGAKSIYYNSAVYTSNSTQICGSANRTAVYAYDGTYWIWIAGGYDSDNNTVPSAYCTTAAATAAKTATCTNYVLLSKSYIQVIITTANTSQTALTLNINSKGAKPIYINGSASSTSNYTLPAGSYFVYYDGTNYYFRTDGTMTGSVTGNAGTATKLATARTVTIGSTGKTFDGSGNVSWTLSEIGAAASSHTHSYAPISHATTDTTYGIGTASNYGHIKLSDTYNSSVSSGAAANGLGASQNALYNAYNTLNTAVSGKAASSHSHSNATTSAAGFMTTTDKAKLDYTNVVYCTCSTAAGTAAKEATIDGNTNFALQKGAIAIIKFTATNTASSCTLNVGSTGAKSIYSGTSVYTGSSSQICGYANRTLIYVYDGTYWVWVFGGYDGNDNTVPSAYCSTAAATAAKTATCTGYVLLSKSFIHVIISTANTSQTALTMNINGKGAKAIYINGSASSTSNYTLPAGSYLVYYDGTNYYFRTDGTLTASITGNAASATKLATARNITIGSAKKSFNGTADVSFSLSEMGISSDKVVFSSTQPSDTGIYWFEIGATR